MTALITFSKKDIYNLTDKDVLQFLIFKDVNNSGRTVIPHRACSFLRAEDTLSCLDPIKCACRHSAYSMQIGIILKLRKSFEEVGRKGLYIRSTLQGNPTKSASVQEYLIFKL